MQTELQAEYPSLNITLLAINQIGYEAGMPSIDPTSTLPIVNDNDVDDIWYLGGDMEPGGTQFIIMFFYFIVSFCSKSSWTFSGI